MVLIDLSTNEVPMLTSDRFMDLVDQCSLPNAGLTIDEDKSAFAICDPFECLKQQRRFSLATIELMQQLKAMREITFGNGKVFYFTRRIPIETAPFKIAAKLPCGL